MKFIALHQYEELLSWDITPCSPLKPTNISEEHIFSILRIALVAAASWWFLAVFTLQPEDGGDMFIRNVN
jgi:hypothetical protein